MRLGHWKHRLVEARQRHGLPREIEVRLEVLEVPLTTTCLAIETYVAHHGHLDSMSGAFVVPASSNWPPALHGTALGTFVATLTPDNSELTAGQKIVLHTLGVTLPPGTDAPFGRYHSLDDVSVDWVACFLALETFQLRERPLLRA
ncbi:hypothetical protein SPRG_17880 [Saprolegnia parasitica CBS 223.65]|uniref:Uncharacterized protein n=1 Tax=Saprolegnia parasitica (strain CBS 223.65) TaxID=695850 RepID=A0A067BES0_SAPPC|nr:hypothetical protein SPRG_17880 [Saprolegnia parasitica CBS 223.65]KDO16613.1 hypothetical protein SPRG_17880 [Saprolegnia parasitica CBS 223.65]|eukprot:XP_012212680.1 hypothetical protein SPRG_17880 [Saprolegnia parasitica CBS 223.65]